MKKWSENIWWQRWPSISYFFHRGNFQCLLSWQRAVWCQTKKIHLCSPAPLSSSLLLFLSLPFHPSPFNPSPHSPSYRASQTLPVVWPAFSFSLWEEACGLGQWQWTELWGWQTLSSRTSPQHLRSVMEKKDEKVKTPWFHTLLYSLTWSSALIPVRILARELDNRTLY